MKDNKKEIQYKILKSEACGHVIEYKMIKKEDDQQEPALHIPNTTSKEALNYIKNKQENAKKIADINERKQELKEKRVVQAKEAARKLKQKGRKPAFDPMAASEKDCECEDKTKKCECEDNQMKKREKFYIQKIQELRKFFPLPTFFDQEKYKKNLREKTAATALDQQNKKDNDLKNTGMVNQRRAAVGLPVLTQGTQSNQGEYVLQQAPKGGERSLNPGLMSRAGIKSPKQPVPNMSMQNQAAAAPAPAPAAAAPAPAAAAAPAPAAAAPAPAAAAAAPAPAQSFGQIFNAKRAEREAAIAAGKYNPETHDVFKYTNPKTGKEEKYHSFTKDDFAKGIGSKYNPAAKQTMAPAESIKDTPGTPNTENTTPANPIKGPDLGSTKLRPGENIIPKNQA